MNSQETPPPELSAQQIVRNFKPISEVSFVYVDGRLHMEIHRKVEMTDQQAFDYAVEAFYLQNIKSTFSDEQKIEAILTGREEKSRENIGGFGITSRRLKDLEEAIPGISKELFSQNGKVVFVGNGLSTAPVEVLQRLGTDAPMIVIVDIFDYKALHQDLQLLQDQFEQRGVQSLNDLDRTLNNSRALVEQINRGKIIAVKYVLGDGNPPEEMRQADLIVNSHGPPESTLHEQIDCLKIGGKLIINSRDLPQTSRARINTIVSPHGKVASIVTRVV